MLRLACADAPALSALLQQYGLHTRLVASEQPIPGSYWGDSEAGLRGDTLYARADTPVHSVLHEAAHYICMSDARRGSLERDAGGDDAEEEAVCYLQVLMAGKLSGVGRERLLADMDAWGYSFRLGAAAVWFRQDAQDARAWLVEQGIVDADGALTGQRRR